MKKGYWPDGLGGIPAEFALFSILPKWVAKQNSPGTTSQTTELGFRNTLRSVLTLSYFVWSPNLIWFGIALTLHCFFPYDIEAAREEGLTGGGSSALPLSGWVLRRFVLNYGACFAYYAYFHVTLYWLKWADRKYKPEMPTAANMLHNMFYWSLGIVQWTWWEALMVRLWATGVVPFASDSEVVADWKALAFNVAFVLLVPLWRDFHFYVAHRFIHVRAIYKYVHSLHHRNADPEPFSGKFSKKKTYSTRLVLQYSILPVQY